MMRTVKGLAALLGLAAIVAGMPVLLIAVHNLGAPRIGWSWQGLLQALMSPDDGTLMLTLFKAAGWVSWAILTTAVVLELAARVRHLPVPQVRGLGVAQGMARSLVAAAAILFVAGSNLTTHATPVEAAPHTVVAPAQLPAPAPAPLKAPVQRHADHTVTVHKGDTLSEIALQETGRASNYPALFKASKSTTQPGGRHLIDPDLILPGWKITIPAASVKTPGEHQRKSPVTDADTTPRVPAEQAGTTPQAPATAGPSAQPTTASSTSADEVLESEPAQSAADGSVPVWLLSGLAGAGSLLAGSLWLVVRRRRAAQFRSRRPGRMIAAPPPELALVEKTLVHEGSPTGELVLFIDEMLRRMAAGFTTAGQGLPELVGVDAAPTRLTVRFAKTVELPDVWEPVDVEDRLVWRVDRDADLEQVGPLESDSPPPWPQLVTLGWDSLGWRLVNLESLGVVSITGDPVYASDLARYLVSELAVSPWSRDVEVDCLAICEELPGLAPARVHFHTDAAVIADRIASAVAIADRMAESGVANLETARATFAGEELWDSRVLVTSTVDAEHLEVLTRLVADQQGRTATSVLLVDEAMQPAGIEMRLTESGRIEVPSLGLDLVVNGLTAAEARGCVDLVAAGQNFTDTSFPAMDPDADEWATFCNEAGSLREELTVPRGSEADDATTLMPEPDEVYLAGTANTVEDLATLAPLVPAEVRARVEAVDPSLDADLAQWWASSCDRPRLQVLGPLKVRVGPTGEPTKAAARPAFYTEVVAYLSTRPGGATTQEVADALGISVARVRRDMTTVRGWLGENPATGTPFLPEAMKSQRAIERGCGLYLIESLLSDADLFRRLRLRGEARGGAEGLEDLRLALRLVNGAPYDDMRTKGRVWLAASRLDQHLLCAIVDVAHMVSTIALDTGDMQQARAAAELAALAAPQEATPQLDLAAIAAGEGQPGKAAAIARGVVTWRDGSGEGPLDLSERAEAILRTHRWLEEASKAS
jgi:LysM repeat protein